MRVGANTDEAVYEETSYNQVSGFLSFCVLCFQR